MKKGILFCMAFFMVFGVFVAATVNGADRAAKKSGDSKILAKVGNEVITEADIEKRIAAAPPHIQNRMNGAKGRQVLLQKLVDLKVFAMEARALKIDREETVQTLIEDQVDTVLAREYLNRQDFGLPGITEEDIRKYYDEHPAEFRKPARVKARHILVAVSADAGEKEVAEARAKAERIRKELEKGGNFSALADRYSDDRKTRKKGGDLGYVSRDKLDAPFSEAAFGLKVGEISEPVKTGRGFHIITVEDRTEEETVELNGAKGRIRANLESAVRKEGMDRTRDRLRKKYNVETFDVGHDDDVKTPKKATDKRSKRKS